MKIGIYSPYLDTSGGGERYMLTIAESLSSKNDVDLFLDTHLQTLDIKSVIEKNSKLLNLNLKKVNLVKAPLGKGTGIWKRSHFLKNYDLIFYLTDGSVFYSTARKNILHIQSPIKVSNKSLWKKIKQKSWDLIIYNSEFTKRECEKYWGIKSTVIYPPVDISSFRSGKKIKQIVTVGRFFSYQRTKKHSLMINSFKKMYDSGKISDWSFHLAGGAGEGDEEYLKELKSLAKGYPIFIHPNLAFADLKNLYSESSIYWHAAGYGEKEETLKEHFGMTTVEAMASGCVPVVIDLGGQSEIVEDKENGFLWKEPEEMGKKTLELIENNELLKKFSEKAKKGIEKFSKERFIEKINNLL